MDHEERSLPVSIEITEGRTAEQTSIKVFGVQVTARKFARCQSQPVAWIPQYSPAQRGTDVFLEKALREIIKDPLAVQRKIGRRYRAAGDCGKHVDFVDHAS